MYVCGACTCVYICTHVVCRCMHMVCVYMYVCRFVSVCVCVCVSVCVCVCVYQLHILTQFTPHYQHTYIQTTACPHNHPNTTARYDLVQPSKACNLAQRYSISNRNKLVSMAPQRLKNGSAF